MTETQRLYTSPRKESYLDPHEIDRLNRRPMADDDDRGGMVLITMMAFVLVGAVLGGAIVYFILG